MNRMQVFLSKISAGQAINLNKFYNLIDSYNLSRTRQVSDIEARQIKGQEYIVSFIQPDLRKDLEKLANINKSNRTTAALQNNSHATQVNGSFLIAREALGSPIVVMIEKNGEYTSSLNYSEDVLIIENRQNFIDIDKTVSFLESYTDFHLKEKMNIIFAEGNVITNRLHQCFLSRYKTIYLCMDFDLGGLTITNNLMSLLPGTNIIFLVPNDIASRLDNIVQRVSNKDIDSVIKLSQQNAALIPFAKLIKEKQKVLEQESYLHGK